MKKKEEGVRMKKSCEKHMEKKQILFSTFSLRSSRLKRTEKFSGDGRHLANSRK